MTSKSAWTLIAFCVISGGATRSSAQPNAAACRVYLPRCVSGSNTPLCIRLQQLCGKLSMPVDPMEVPDCGKDQEIVMVPTCRCGTALDTDATVGNNEGCTSCTSDGLRLECQKVR